jgi:hypothetical protein
MSSKRCLSLSEIAFEVHKGEEVATLSSHNPHLFLLQPDTDVTCIRWGTERSESYSISSELRNLGPDDDVGV